MHEDEYQEVAFSEYCLRCKHKDCDSTDEPCNECLDNPVNQYSKKPVKFEEAKKK